MPNKSVNFWINVPIETLSTKLETNDQCDYIGLVWKVYVKKILTNVAQIFSNFWSYFENWNFY